MVGLKELSRRTVWAYVHNLKPGCEVTLDVDAQLIETSKGNARCCYDGYKAYQPMQVSWAQTMLVLEDEFRAGNVPASKDMIRVVLPEESADAHPKRLRFAVFTMMGRLVSHAGQTLLRIAAQALAAILTPGRAPLRSVFTLQTDRCLRQRHHA